MYSRIFTIFCGFFLAMVVNLITPLYTYSQTNIDSLRKVFEREEWERLAKEEYETKVQLVVSGDDDLVSQVKSYLLRELRELPGVMITTGRDFEYKIEIIVMRVKNRKGTEIGYCMSEVRMRRFDISQLISLTQIDNDDNKYIELIAPILANSEEIQYDLDSLWSYSIYRYDGDHTIQLGSVEDLKQTCIELIAEFDQEDIEPEREVYEAVRKICKNLLEKTK